MNRWYLDENDIDIYLKCTDDVRWHYNKKELVRILNDLETKVAEKNNTIENWQTMYESVVQTCHNDKEEIERLNKQLETQENTITNLVEDNRASQEWYKKQLADTEEQNKRVLEKLELIVSANQELEQKLAESESKHLLDEKEWQDYCAFKHIEPQIKGCLDREREYEKQLAEKVQFGKFQSAEELYKAYQNLEREYTKSRQQLSNTEAQNKRVLEKLDLIVRSNQELEKENELMAKTLKMTKFVEKEVNQDKISFAVEQLEKVKGKIKHNVLFLDCDDYVNVMEELDNQIKQLKEMK